MNNVIQEKNAPQERKPRRAQRHARRHAQRHRLWHSRRHAQRYRSGSRRVPCYRAQRHAVAIRRFAVLVAACAVLGVMLGLVLPHISRPVLVMTGGTASVGQAASMLRALPVEQPHPSSGYQRDSFGFRTTDDDGNGCDVREDVLARDLRDITFDADGCTVRSGTLHDPYTGTVIDFHRGKTTSSAVQIDHVVALRNAWISGADEWNASRRIAYANDPANLLAVQGAANQDKSDASADHWLPPAQGFQCEYVAMQVAIKHTWQLSVTRAEKETMGQVLAQCPGMDAADASGVVSGAAADIATDTAADVASGVVAATSRRARPDARASPCSCSACRTRRSDEP